MTEDMQLAEYSSKTQQAYVAAVRQLFAHFKCNPAQLTEYSCHRQELSWGGAPGQRPPARLLIVALLIDWQSKRMAAADFYCGWSDLIFI